MEAPTSTFDLRTADPFPSRVAGSPHYAYRDGSGNICLVAIGTSPSGGVPVNEAALKWLEQQAGGHFVRLINENVGFDLTIKLEDLPSKSMREGKLGRYAFYDPEDFAAPPFPPYAGQGGNGDAGAPL